MGNKRKVFLFLFLAGVVTIGAAAIIFFAKNNNSSEGIILFYGDGCPHCAIVDEYIAANNIEEKIKFQRKEVFNDKSNARLLSEKAKICGISGDSVGVPLLWDGKSCIVGDQPIIDYFSK